MVRYDIMETIMSGRNMVYPPVSSAMRNTPVSGANITPDIRPAIPSRAKFCTEISASGERRFMRVPNMNPVRQPRNRLGANIPPQPPPALVAVDANTLVRTINPR